MNKARRKRLEEAQQKLEEAMSIIEECKDEEQDAYDNLPESFQEGERGSVMSDAIDALDNACTDLDTVLSYVQDAIDA